MNPQGYQLHDHPQFEMSPPKLCFFSKADPSKDSDSNGSYAAYVVFAQFPGNHRMRGLEMSRQLAAGWVTRK